MWNLTFLTFLTPAQLAELLAHKPQLLAILRIGKLFPDTVFAQAQACFKGIGYWYELEERAGILEFDGGLSREEAARQAFTEIRDRCGEAQVVTNDTDVARLPLAGIGK